MVIVVISSCSAGKDDSIPVPRDSRKVFPMEYLGNDILVRRLETTRKAVFRDPRSQVGDRYTYAFDLYVRAGHAYRHLRANQHKLRELMLAGELNWYFLSGGYGIVNALEPARKYQATFNRTIAYQNKIPFTAKLWRDVLSEIVDAIISKLEPEYSYFFGSRDYTAFIEKTEMWSSKKNLKMFESTGSLGPNWLSPIIGELSNLIIKGCLDEFNKKYNKFTKQELK